jgi:hypothetical protein
VYQSLYRFGEVEMSPGRLFICILLVASTVGSAAFPDQEDLAIDSLHDHKFLSAIVTDGEEKSLYHEVCNLSSDSSAFLWKKAGLGVDALNQLHESLCARRTQRGSLQTKREYSNVEFQDGASGDIDTIYVCKELFGVNSCGGRALDGSLSFVTDLSIFMATPDENNVEMETITIAITEIGDGYVEVHIESSDGVEHAALVLGQTDATLEELRGLLGGVDEIQIDTFGYFREIGEVGSTFLTEPLPSKAPTLLFKRPEGGGINLFFKMKDANRLGEILSILILNQGYPVALSEALLPLQSQ